MPKSNPVRLALLLALALLPAASAPGQPRDEKAAAEGELRALVRAWNAAEVKGDAAAMDRLLAEEFSFLGGSNRAQYLALLKPDPSLVIESSAVEVSAVELYGDTAVVTASNSIKARKASQPIEGKFLAMTVWVKRGGRWLCVKACIHDIPGK
ncbi:MAG TPA: nuclear transport factor 2 family protein [Pyrinomonadaceae bacterium]